MRRLRAWLGMNSNAHTIIAMSDPGAHTFEVLQSFLDESRYRVHVKRLLFLETMRQTNPYSAAIHTRFMGDKRIHVLTGPAWTQAILLELLGLIPGFASLGIGGHVRLSPNPFSAALQETHGQVEMEGFTGKLMHIFPIASGTMLDGFLASRDPDGKDSFIGVMTGHPVTRRLLSRKYRNDKSVTLVASQPITWSRYIKKGHEFHAETGVWLDPVHSIHLLKALENQCADGIVLWITCPLITRDPALLEGSTLC